MAKTTTFFALCSITNFILVLNEVFANSTGLTIRLIHPHSPQSPFFRSNISHEERIKRLSFQSNLRANYLARTPVSRLQIPLDAQLYHYIVKIGIGTFKSKPPYKEYHLEIDTGSSLSWMQCEGCTKCFNQTPKPFPKDLSTTFHPILNKENKNISYEIEYEDGDTTRGILARESFYVNNKGRLVKIENVEFGCGLYNSMRYSKNNKIAGLMGLGWGDESLVKQLGSQSKGKFSYCLPVLTGKIPNTYLRFGGDIPNKDNSKSTPLYKRNGLNPYYVNLQGISINKNRLNISPATFAFNGNGSSGCIIDTGTPYSLIVSPAFDALKLELEKYFSRLKGLKKIKSDSGLELCYERGSIRPEGFKMLPSVTFHLQGPLVDFVLKPEAVFLVVKRLIPFRLREYFCLAMHRHRSVTIIGSHQQTNHRVIHDTDKRKLIFYPDDCAKNP